MKKWNVIVMMFVGVVFAGYAAADALVYDNFESYSDTDELALVWNAFDEYNPSLVPALNTTDSYEGSQCLELDSPVTSDWGVELGQQADTTDVSAYNVMTAMVKIGTDSITWDVEFELRDIDGLTIGYGGYTELWASSDWQQATIALDGEGDLTQLAQVLVWFNCDPTTEEEGIAQLYVDDIEFSNIPEPATLAILGLGGLLLRRKK
jgi:hypothetical protein